MSTQHATSATDAPEDLCLSAELTAQLLDFLAPLQADLARVLDLRVLRTFLVTMTALIRLSNAPRALLLSELGGQIRPPHHAPAGTKAITTLLASAQWDADTLAAFLWRDATDQVTALRAADEPVYALWDDSVLEKPESETLEDLSPVRSSKAARLLHIRPGWYHPPLLGSVFVPGWHWVGVLITGTTGAPHLAAMDWWTSRGAQAQSAREVQMRRLVAGIRTWGAEVCHIFDRGFAGTPWLTILVAVKARFIVRWTKRYKLQPGHGAQAGEAVEAWKIPRGKKAQGGGEVFNTHTRRWEKRAILSLPVTHPAFPGVPLWLVVVRRPGKKGSEPWYLLTNEPAATVSVAWGVARAYLRRWQIESVWRYEKAELGCQSIRVRTTARRDKLLLLLAVVHAFLLRLMAEALRPLTERLLRRWCHRTGRRLAAVRQPLYRARWALARLWHDYPPTHALFAALRAPARRCVAQTGEDG